MTMAGISREAIPLTGAGLALRPRQYDQVQMCVVQSQRNARPNRTSYSGPMQTRESLLTVGLTAPPSDVVVVTAAVIPIVGETRHHLYEQHQVAVPSVDSRDDAQLRSHRTLYSPP